MSVANQELVKDARRCVKSGVASLDTSRALLEREESPTRSLNQGYTANRALAHIRSAMAEARKAEMLLATLEEGGAHE